MTGLGLGPAAMREFLKQIVFKNSAVCAVIADPEKNNVRSLRAFEKAGFKAGRTIQLVGEDCQRQIVRMDRPQAAAMCVDWVAVNQRTD